jgi:hydroxyacylglutathione hydrolase
MFMRMIYDEKLAQAAYLLGCQKTGEAIVFDPQRDIDRYLGVAKANGLRIVAVAETHIHADFVSGAREMAEATGATVYVSGEGGPEWQSEWVTQGRDGKPYPHRVLRDGDTFDIGGIHFRVLHTPGHTPEHVVYLVTDRGAGADQPMGLIAGDFVFVGDLGRPDLLETAAGQAGATEPSARQLYHSLKRLDEIEDFVQVWPGHGAGSACGKALGAVPTSTIGYERRFNAALRRATSESAFVDFILDGQPEPPMYFADMKRVNRAGPGVLGLAQGVPAPERISVEALRELARTGDASDGPVVIDTRPWERFRDGHVPGSLCVPLDKAFNSYAGSFVGLEQPIVLIVEAERLDEALRDLIRIGLDLIVGWLPPDELQRYADGSHALESIRDLTPAEAAAMLAAGQAALLDVRRATEYASGHIVGACNIAHTRLALRAGEVPGGKPLIVQCQGGVRSARAASYLKRLGHAVMNMQGGYLAWRASQG